MTIDDIRNMQRAVNALESALAYVRAATQLAIRARANHNVQKHVESLQKDLDVAQRLARSACDLLQGPQVRLVYMTGAAIDDKALANLGAFFYWLGQQFARLG